MKEIVKIQMKVMTIWLSVVLSLFLLTACGLTADGMIHSRLNRLNNSQTEDIAEEQVESLLLLADQNNIDGIKEIFSITAQNSGISNAAVQQMIDLFCKKVVSVERLGGGESEENNYGELTKSYSYSFSVKTECSEYLLILAGYTDDANNAQNIGVSHVVIMPHSWESYPDEADGTGVFIYTE